MSATAGWYPDPLSRHEHRYWDGERWTEHVADAGQTASDPLEAAPPEDREGRAAGEPEQAESEPGLQAATSPSPTQGPDPGPDTGPAQGYGAAQPPGAGSGHGYGAAQPPGTVSTAGQRSNGKALGSFLISILLGWIPLLGGAAAVVLGVMARREIRQSGGQQTGDGLAVAGIVIGVLGVLSWLALFVLLIIGIGLTAPFLDQFERELQRELEQQPQVFSTVRDQLRVAAATLW